jgi:uncharacterized protein (DUF2147 family)
MNKMKRLFTFTVILTLVAVFSNLTFSQIKADDVTGVWLNEDKDAHVKIENTNGHYFGKIVWLKEPIDEKTGQPKLDKENPDADLQKRPIMGLNLLSDFKFDGNQEWKDGDIYDPKSGKIYSCYMLFTDDSKNKLKVRGYIGISLIGRTTYWTRVE